MSESNGNGNETNRPVQTIRYGAIKATIWRNATRTGTMFSTTVSRSFKGDDDNWRESHSFGPSDLPTVAKVLLDAHTWVQEQIAGEKEEARQPRPQQVDSRKARHREPARA
jgi:hypothetical protein